MASQILVAEELELLREERFRKFDVAVASHTDDTTGETFEYIMIGWLQYVEKDNQGSYQHYGRIYTSEGESVTVGDSDEAFQLSHGDTNLNAYNILMTGLYDQGYFIVLTQFTAANINNVKY